MEELVQQSRALKQQVAEARLREQEAAIQRDEVLCTIGNLVHDDVPVSQDEVRNVLGSLGLLGGKGRVGVAVCRSGRVQLVLWLVPRVIAA